MFCTHCGAYLEGHERFCPGCGACLAPSGAAGQAGSSLPPPPRLARRRAGSSLFMAAMRQAGRHGL